MKENKANTREAAEIIRTGLLGWGPPVPPDEGGRDLDG